MSVESEFVEAIMDGEIQRAMADFVYDLRKAFTAWGDVISSAARIVEAYREKRERAEAARRVHEWKGDWLI